MIQLSALERDYFQYGANRALEAYARHLRAQIKLCHHVEANSPDKTGVYDAANDRRRLQRQLNDFNHWRRQRRKATR
jgi:hypothetical protein